MHKSASCKDKIGEVTPGERDHILNLHERRNALKELFLTLDSDFLTENEKNGLRDRIVDDLQKTTALYEEWWRDIGVKFSVKSVGHGELEIDFQSRQLFFYPKPTDMNGACCRESIGLPKATDAD